MDDSRDAWASRLAAEPECPVCGSDEIFDCGDCGELMCWNHKGGEYGVTVQGHLDSCKTLIDLERAAAHDWVFAQEPEPERLGLRKKALRAVAAKCAECGLPTSECEECGAKTCFRRGCAAGYFAHPKFCSSSN